MPRKSNCIFSISAAIICVAGCCQIGGYHYVEDLAGGYTVRATDVKEQAEIVRKKEVGSGSTRVVRAMVFAYGWNNDFILAKQHPEKDGKIDTRTTHWYIIEVASGKVHGPLSEGEFNKLRTELKVPAEMSFKTIP